MRFDAALFDLDGTLLDTLTDLSTSANHALNHVGRPTYEREAYRTLVGQGVRNLFIDALGSGHQHLLDDALAAFHTHYARHCFDTTTAYPGIETMLQRLSDMGVRLGVLSNKPHAATVDVVSRFFDRIDWAVVRGHKAGTAPKPDPASAIEVLGQLSVKPVRCVYVGDSKVDMLTGQSAGLFTVGVSWGFRTVEELRANGADTIIDQASELTTLIGV